MSGEDLVVDGDERVVRGESSGGAFAVDQQGLLPPVHHVLLHFGDVVRDVVDDVCHNRRCVQAELSNKRRQNH